MAARQLQGLANVTVKRGSSFAGTPAGTQAGTPMRPQVVHFANPDPPVSTLKSPAVPFQSPPVSALRKPPAVHVHSSSKPPSSTYSRRQSLATFQSQPSLRSAQSGATVSTIASLNMGTRLLDIPIKSRATVNSARLTGVMYSRTARNGLSEEKKTQLFRQMYLERTLGTNKLQRFPLSQSDEKLLENTCLVSQQLQKLFVHLNSYDMATIFHCVTPMATTEEEIAMDNRLARADDGSIITTSLFSKSHILNPDEVALSSIWMHLWAGVNEDDSSYQDDQWASLRYLENNTDPVLFNKCMEAMKEYPVNAHGGPLFLALVQEQIQNSSEPAMAHLLSLVAKLKISKYPGEDVSKYVTVIRAVHATLQSASEAGNLYFDEDSFIQTVVERLQTTSVPEFNEPYKIMLAKAIDDLDQPTLGPGNRVIRSRAKRTKFPLSFAAIMYGAEQKYGRIVAKGGWNVSRRTPVANFQQQTVRTCFNCGGNHLLPECDKPRDEQKIAANRAAYDAKRVAARSLGGRGPGRGGRFPFGRGRGGRGGGRGGTPRANKTTIAGIPMKTNKLGELVPDQQKIKARQDKARKEIAAEMTAALMETLQDPPAVQPRTPQVTYASRGVAHLEALRESVLAAHQRAIGNTN